jgi:hypothetical protein
MLPAPPSRWLSDPMEARWKRLCMQPSDRRAEASPPSRRICSREAPRPLDGSKGTDRASPPYPANSMRLDVPETTSARGSGASLQPWVTHESDEALDPRIRQSGRSPRTHLTDPAEGRRDDDAPAVSIATRPESNARCASGCVSRRQATRPRVRAFRMERPGRESPVSDLPCHAGIRAG